MILEAQITAFIGATLVLGAFALAHRRFPSDFSWYWIAAWSFYVTRFLLDIFQTLGWQATILEFGAIVATATSAILILLAVVQLADWKQPTETVVLGLWGALIGWAAVSVVFDFAFVVAYTPLYVAFGAIHLVSASLFYRYLKQYSYSSSPLLIGSLVIWGIHKMDYPLLRPIDALAPYGYLLGALLSFTTGLGVMMFLLEEAERRATTERNTANRRFEEYEELFNNIPDPVYIHDLDGNFLKVNDTAIDVLGYSRDEFASMTPFDIVAPAHSEKIQSRIDIATTDESASFDSAHVTAGGRTIDVSVNAEKITYQGEDAILAVARNVTERKKLEQGLSVVNRILRHDIRSAVNVIGGNANLAMQSPAAAEEALETVLEAVRRLYGIGEKAQTIEQLLTAETSKTRVMNLSEMIDASVTAIQNTHRHVTVDCDCLGEIDVEVAIGFEEAIEHVLENAVVHNDKDEPKIWIEATRENETVEVQIADNGPGIPRDEIEPINAGRETALQHTSGLGLWLVYWLSKESGGRLEISRNEPTGTIVTMCVPTA